MTIHLSLKTNDWVFNTGPWFRPFVSWWTNPNVWTLRFGNFQQFVSIFHFYLGISRYCVFCLSCAPWQSGYDIHDFCCCYLRCRWSLFSEHCTRPRIVFYNIASEYNPTFELLVLYLQFGILQMADVHQWGKLNFDALGPCFIDHLWFTSDICQVPRPNFLHFSPFLVHLSLLRDFSWLLPVSQMHVTIQTLRSQCLYPRAVWTNRWMVHSRVSPSFFDLRLRFRLRLLFLNRTLAHNSSPVSSFLSLRIRMQTTHLFRFPV